MSDKIFPRYSDIYEVNANSVIVAETAKCRLALIVSNDINNELSQTVIVLSITNQPAKKQYPFEVLVLKDVAGLTTPVGQVQTTAFLRR
jgi:mRNA-degrading endonuclease toxin of MazEF toxin-antitoxin module